MVECLSDVCAGRGYGLEEGNRIPPKKMLSASNSRNSDGTFYCRSLNMANRHVLVHVVIGADM